ncbi:cellulose synthase/poly-beta-1,6-N-acetylglucosamine synthase-like glycosyltransferase [Winogradskyella wandonensis]|uniref:Cellulose synthase/poly-beta-1,6-N-acetylglucosamine synthase-like glycosyltransferase n=1 Tax=Winogradskyella wandonensis TaxID=1442586 RepID=A0A4R1KNE3_9FLAO|nr:glycosyltransferase [Winogradskyella wandonensis]TCK65169.1 cellulose synthase/poly-beta-1,6-N-acetylglucosamine synthase-like glycosyltransferase [Winogradskyella wandonensis]
MLLIICFIIVLIYLIVIGWLNYGFNKVEDFKLQDLEPKTKFSVVIPFRNEAENLPYLLNSIKALNYPNSHFEVILVDDESSDDWESVLDTFRRKRRNTRTDYIRVISNIRTSNSPKKDAISSAIQIAQFDWIVTTDADCMLPKYWLDTLDEFIQTKNTIAIAGPVKFTGLSSFFNRFQIIDTLSLQGATIGGFGIKKPFMCNGANFAYKKSAFFAVNGFKGNDSSSSGDDVFLLQKLVKAYKEQVHFLKSEKAIVSTKVTDSLSRYIQQRLRWASKSSRYTLWFPKLLGLIVLLTNLIIVTLIPLYLTGFLTLKTATLLFLVKFGIDLLIIFKTARFYKQEPVLLSYVFVSLLHPFMTIYIALRFPFSRYKWKGRSFKN